MTESKDLLIEIGTEELPPRALPGLSGAFADQMQKGIADVGLTYGKIRRFATPRRLAVIIEQLSARQADRTTEKRGPSVSASFTDDGKPTKAAEGFARSCGVTVEELDRIKTDKGEWLGLQVHEPGKYTEELIPAIAVQTLSRLPIPKRMRWGESNIEFVRPVHWVVVLFGKDIIPFELFGIKTGRKTHGHRFHHPGAIKLENPSEYQHKLRDPGYVIADFNERREQIRSQALTVAKACRGTVIIDEDLLDEITGLVEWPVGLSGSFDKKYLSLPPEVLIACMQNQQKYFPLQDADGKLLNHFIAFSNIDSLDPEIVRAGNERVIDPRLNDAAFFWQQDLRRPLAEYQHELEGIVYQKQLGTLAEKTTRLEKLAGHLATLLDQNIEHARRAATLSKCDLVTEMVGEFPALQGIMGRYYAIESNELTDIARSLEEQYFPRFSGDRLPETETGIVLSLSDKLDTLAGIFAIGQVPSGEKDPFGLRRAAIGILRIIIEGKVDLDLVDCLTAAVDGYEHLKVSDDLVNQVFEYMMERLRHYYLEQGISMDIFESVYARRPTRPLDFHDRIQAVRNFITLPEAESLAAANKRISNILKQADDQKIETEIREELLQETAERDLAAALNRVSKIVMPMLNGNEYSNALTELAGLKAPVDAFFDEVMVMCDDEVLKTNRLALLKDLNQLFLRTADISRLQN